MLTKWTDTLKEGIIHFIIPTKRRTVFKHVFILKYLLQKTCKQCTDSTIWGHTQTSQATFPVWGWHLPWYSKMFALWRHKRLYSTKITWGIIVYSKLLLWMKTDLYFSCVKLGHKLAIASFKSFKYTMWRR